MTDANDMSPNQARTPVRVGCRPPADDRPHCPICGAAGIEKKQKWFCPRCGQLLATCCD